MSATPSLFAQSLSGLRAVATIVHAVPGAVGELGWPDKGPAVAVASGACGCARSCQLRGAVGRAMQEHGLEGFADVYARQGQPVARLVSTSTCEEVGVGIYRFVRPFGVLALFATTLPAELVRKTVTGVASRQSGPNAELGPLDIAARTAGMRVGIYHDELTEVSLVWVTYPRIAPPETEALMLDATLVLAGACAAAGAEAAMHADTSA